MAKSIIHVNRHFIAANTKDGGNRPIYSVKSGRNNVRYAREVVIHGPSRLVYSGDQLSCGARAWIETDSDLLLVDEMDYQEAKELA
jgi:ribonuclease BN (tRNA processing enzyme)